MNERQSLNPLRRLRRPAWADQEPSWADAKPGLIRAAVARAQARPSGGWFVIAGSREIRSDRGFGTVLRLPAGSGGHVSREVVAWRDDDGTLHAGPGACPHLGASLCDAPVHEGRLVCRWHGLPLGPGGRPGWRTFPVHDDGVLAWVRLETVGEAPTDRPYLGPRPDPARSLPTVATVIGRCEPEDILANRLDPWHGAWFHPYSFAALRVLSAPAIDCPPAEDRFLLEVTFTLGKRVGVPVRAAFTCPDPRTITMEIVDGEGRGTVVETHATPLPPGPDGLPRTAVIEAVVAHSDRWGFEHTRRIGSLLRPLVASTARRLWVDDIAYAERCYALRAATRDGTTAAANGSARPRSAEARGSRA